ncbi:hypothetical protein EJV47_11855 [Hymenobacter gummosus]|uniref:Uncharacterized protein n=1 Tax=Hymenobacter gummosus TaxID=1776032 RepID=A0A431U2E5_9BACT|nr:hypothetical protein [Hymenobacter gummosus]RTQ49516.1 hypothetical protein EJV47_11855 [Hymenobacter gummosus]
MKLLTTTLVLLGLTTASATAQQFDVNLPSPNAGLVLRPTDQLTNKLQGKMDHTYGNAWRNLDGQPWIQRSWQPGELVMSKGRMVDLLLRYDAYGQQLLGVTKGKTDTLLLDHRLVQSFVMKDEAGAGTMRTFRRFDNAPQPEQRLNFVEVLHAGKYSLLKHHGRQLHRAAEGGVVLNGDSNNDRISEVYTYYLSRPDGTTVPVKLNAKAISAAAPELAAAIKTAQASKKADSSEAGMAALLDGVDKAQ